MNIPAPKGLWLPCAFAFLTCTTGLAIGPEAPASGGLPTYSRPQSVAASPAIGVFINPPRSLTPPPLPEAHPVWSAAGMLTGASPSLFSTGRSLLRRYPASGESADPAQGPSASLHPALSVAMAASTESSWSIDPSLLDLWPPADGLDSMEGVLFPFQNGRQVDLAHKTFAGPTLTHHLELHLERATDLRFGPPRLAHLVRSGDWAACATEFLAGNDEQDLDFLLLLGLRQTPLGANPLRRHWQVPAAIEALQALPNGTLLAILRDGTYRLVTLEGQEPTSGVWHPRSVATNRRAPHIRQVACEPGPANRIAMGGEERKLEVFDLNRGLESPVLVADLDKAPRPGDAISSISWSLQDSGQVLAATLDEGVLLLFDIRQAPPALRLKAVYAQQWDLFCHLFINPNEVVLGYRNGNLGLMDLRHPGELFNTWTDPQVTMPGQLEMNAERDRMVVSGIDGFSVYALSAGRLSLCFHAGPEPGKTAQERDLPICYEALFGAKNDVWTVDTLGQASVVHLEP